MHEIMWYLTRASGVVAMVLIVAAIADGLIFSGKEGGRRLRPAWWMDLHRGLGGYALAFTGFHLLTSYGAGLGVTLAQIVVPSAAPQFSTAFTFGVLALYLMVITVFSSWPKRLLGRGLWHAVHLLSIPAAVLVALHGYQLGTDAPAPWYLAVMVALAALVTYPLFLRLSGIRNRRAERLAPATTRIDPSARTTDARVLADAVR